MTPTGGEGNFMKNDLEDVFAQIGQVASVVENIENQKKDMASFGKQDDKPGKEPTPKSVYT